MCCGARWALLVGTSKFYLEHYLIARLGVKPGEKHIMHLCPYLTKTPWQSWTPSASELQCRSSTSPPSSSSK